jgi:hypothetical protein
MVSFCAAIDTDAQSAKHKQITNTFIPSITFIIPLLYIFPVRVKGFATGLKQ